MKEQWDCVLNDLEELGDKELLVLTNQYNIEIFFLFRLLPFDSSTFDQTNFEILKFVSKMIFSTPEFNPSIFFSK